MVKKRGKTNYKKRKVEKSNENSKKSDNIQKILIENFVSSQRVMVDLSEKVSNLTGQISKLLELFEKSAKTLIEKDIKLGDNSDKETVEKLNKLLEQNKIIARGLALLHEPNQNNPQYQQSSQNQPQEFSQQKSNEQRNSKYQKSISSGY